MLEKVVSILFPVFAVVLIGYVVGKKIKPDMVSINKINVDVLLPSLVFSSLSTMPLDANQAPLLIAAVIAVIIPGLLMALAAPFLKLPFKTWGPPQMFRNSGNLAIPLFGYAFGESAAAPAVLLFVVSTFLHITLGLTLLSNKDYSLKQVFKMPVLTASIAALAFNLLGIQLWQPAYEALTLIGNAAVPIMLLSLGVQLTKIQWSGLAIGLKCSVLSLITGGISFALVYAFIPLPIQQLQMMVLFAMLPPAVMNYLFAERFQVGPGAVASMVLFGNFFAVLTLPMLLYFAFHLTPA